MPILHTRHIRPGTRRWCGRGASLSHVGCQLVYLLRMIGPHAEILCTPAVTMQGYNQFYQSQASAQAGPSSGPKFISDASQQHAPQHGYGYPVQAVPMQQHSMSGVVQSYGPQDIPSYPMPTSSHSSSSSSLSFPSQSMSPNSLRSSISSLNTPVTPLDLNSPRGSHDRHPQGSWFGAMQESYLAKNKGYSDYPRPPLQRMHRMSVCVPRTAQQYSVLRPQADQAAGQYLSVGDQAPRRASVATFQPTASRPSPVPARPPMQSAGNSEPALQAQSFGQEHTLSSPDSQFRQIPSLKLEVPTIISPAPLAEASSEVDRLYAEVFGIATPSSISQQATPLASLYAPQPGASITASPTIYSPSSQVTPTMPSSENDNYNFSGVLLQPEDLHMLSGDGLSPTSMEMPLYDPQQSSHQNTGWQTSFSLTVPPPSRAQLQPPLPINAAHNSWNFSSFHGLQPVAGSSHSSSMGERALSAPPREEPMFYPTLDRRRGSSVDSAAMSTFVPALPSVLEPVNPQLLSPTRTSPAYLGPGLSPFQQSSIAARRSTVGPGSLVLQQVPRAALPATPPNRSAQRSRGVPPASAPPTANRPSASASPTPRRYAGRGSGSRRGSGNAAPMFINFTSKDANKLLSGVAPSGSSKRKRDEEEARSAKSSRSEGMKSPGASPIATASSSTDQ